MFFNSNVAPWKSIISTWKPRLWLWENANRVKYRHKNIDWLHADEIGKTFLLVLLICCVFILNIIRSSFIIILWLNTTVTQRTQGYRSTFLALSNHHYINIIIYLIMQYFRKENCCCIITAIYIFCRFLN